MINKLKRFFLKPSKIRSITSISIITIATFSFSGMAIAGSFLNNNYQTISKLIEVNQMFIMENDKATVSGVNVGQNDWILLSNYFGKSKQNQNSYWLMFNDSSSAYKYWNKLYQNNQLFKIETSFKNLNKILETYKSEFLFANMINLNSNLNYNLGSNNVILPIGITLAIISSVILSLILTVHLIEFRNMKINEVIQEKPDLDDEDIF